MASWDWSEEERIPVTTIFDGMIRARKHHACDGNCTGIEPREMYRKVVALVDGEFTAIKRCLWCDNYEPRPKGA